MLASKNLIPPCTTPEDGLHWLDLLAGELNVRLLEARELSPGLWPKTLVLSWRTGYGYGNNMRSRQAPFSFSKDSTPAHIETLAKRLWREACPEIQRAKGGMDIHSVSSRPRRVFWRVRQLINQLSLTFAGVGRMEDGQKNITSFLGKRGRATDVDLDADVKSEMDDVKSAFEDAWACSTCGHRLDLHDPMYSLLLQEHQDYHFALELSRAPAPRVPTTGGTAVTRVGPGPDPKRRKKDIRSFFKPR